MKNVIKTVERIKDRYGKNELVFKDEEGRIAYLDIYVDKDLVREMVPAAGGKIKCYVVKSLTRNDFIRTSINGTGLDTHINTIPNLSYSSLNRLGKEFVWFLNTIYNAELKGTTAFSIIKDNPNPIALPEHMMPDTWESVVIDGLTLTNYINIMYYIHNKYSKDTKTGPKPSDPYIPVYGKPSSQPYESPFNQAGFHPQYQQQFNQAGFHPQQMQQPKWMNNNNGIVIPNLSNMPVLDRFNKIISNIQLNVNYSCRIDGQIGKLVVKKVYLDKDPIIVLSYYSPINNSTNIRIITKDINLNELYALDPNQPITPIF